MRGTCSGRAGSFRGRRRAIPESILLRKIARRAAVLASIACLVAAIGRAAANDMRVATPAPAIPADVAQRLSQLDCSASVQKR